MVCFSSWYRSAGSGSGFQKPYGRPCHSVPAFIRAKSEKFNTGWSGMDLASIVKATCGLRIQSQLDARRICRSAHSPGLRNWPKRNMKSQTGQCRNKPDAMRVGASHCCVQMAVSTQDHHFTGGGLPGPWAATVDSTTTFGFLTLQLPTVRSRNVCGARTENCPPPA